MADVLELNPPLGMLMNGNVNHPVTSSANQADSKTPQAKNVASPPVSQKKSVSSDEDEEDDDYDEEVDSEEELEDLDSLGLGACQGVEYDVADEAEDETVSLEVTDPVARLLRLSRASLRFLEEKKQLRHSSTVGSLTSLPSEESMSSSSTSVRREGRVKASSSATAISRSKVEKPLVSTPAEPPAPKTSTSEPTGRVQQHHHRRHGSTTSAAPTRQHSHRRSKGEKKRTRSDLRLNVAITMPPPPTSGSTEIYLSPRSKQKQKEKEKMRRKGKGKTTEKGKEKEKTKRRDKKNSKRSTLKKEVSAAEVEKKLEEAPTTEKSGTSVQFEENRNEKVEETPNEKTEGQTREVEKDKEEPSAEKEKVELVSEVKTAEKEDKVEAEGKVEKHTEITEEVKPTEQHDEKPADTDKVSDQLEPNQPEPDRKEEPVVPTEEKEVPDVEEKQPESKVEETQIQHAEEKEEEDGLAKQPKEKEEEKIVKDEIEDKAEATAEQKQEEKQEEKLEQSTDEVRTEQKEKEPELKITNDSEAPADEERAERTIDPVLRDSVRKDAPLNLEVSNSSTEEDEPAEHEIKEVVKPTVAVVEQAVVKKEKSEVVEQTLEMAQSSSSKMNVNIGGRDEYGFAIKKEEYEAWKAEKDDTSKKAVRDKRQAFWAKFTSKKFKITFALKEAIRGGIPSQYRSLIWQHCSGSLQLLKSNPGVYENILAKTADQTSSATIQINLDLRRTFPENDVYMADAGIERLRRVLVAYSWYNTEVGYCQSMNFVCGMLLLFMSEEEAFWMMVVIVEKYLNGYYTNTMESSHVDQRVLRQLVARKFPTLSDYLQKCGVELSWVTRQWFLCIFIDVLPVETTLRVWDAFFMEGSKVLFRVALALLKLKQQKILATPDDGISILKEIKEAGLTLHDADSLLKLAFHRIGGLPRASIAKLRSAHRVQVIKAREKAENMR
eukprot:TRINITY_DN6163_c0_g1_i1.p1 TRINITY_DN6163_c0_g1~~TRINITY_DN6163_c0_g1_i1.p1  ORF type:complete len:947 (-),score=304.27 TRINITY_DN6163_c0_g1_i1:204-3044(-)